MQQHTLLHVATNEPRTEAPPGIESSKEQRYFPDRPCPIIKISESSMTKNSLLLTGSWQTLISKDLCDAFGMKGPPLVTATQRKSVDV
ncbi:hypothetical protein T4E_4178 [Trichinella pseudospiralis]|uniref:Uncharacterized protein n=1 Tax=Trichinella pseudospiralis TaxID=6337 RepID=A0A0V0YMF5_TRIPS|nr:hypothetical protein T4E_4178 [Trichinella pseudospiralis]